MHARASIVFLLVVGACSGERSPVGPRATATATPRAAPGSAPVCRGLLNADAASALEARAREGRATCDDRARLAGHYLELQLEVYDRWLAQLDEHFVSLAHHCPDTNQVCLLQYMNPSLALAATWKSQAAASPTDTVVTDNAAVVEHQVKRNEKMKDDPRLLDGRGELARQAFADGRMELATAYAMEVLLHLPMAPRNWNTGNLIYDAHSTLGLVALRAGDVASARRHLLAAGRTPDSPQLNSFGPDLELAAELLAAGEREVVLAHLELCKRFWETAGSNLDEWQREIRDGEASTMPRRRR